MRLLVAILEYEHQGTIVNESEIAL
jgi:hypothetical protein